MPLSVRIVPVTQRHFDEACARPGAVIERLKVMVPDGPGLPIDYTGVTRADGAFAVVDHYIADHQSGRYILNFERYQERPPVLLGWDARFFRFMSLAVPKPVDSRHCYVLKQEYFPCR